MTTPEMLLAALTSPASPCADTDTVTIQWSDGPQTYWVGTLGRSDPPEVATLRAQWRDVATEIGRASCRERV